MLQNKLGNWIGGAVTFAPQLPKNKMNIGLDCENMHSNPQVDFLLGVSKVHSNTDYDGTYKKETGAGALKIPDTKEFYMGEAL